MEQVMDSAFRATQANYEQGYKDGFEEGRQIATASSYDAGWEDGFDRGKTVAHLELPSETDLWGEIVDQALDRLIRHFDRTDARVAEALRDVLKDLHHPSRIWDAPKEKTHA